jgi:hypothetical protein
MTRLTIAETLEQGFEVLGLHRRADYDFADAKGVSAALEFFEAERVSKVDSEAPGSVRLSPI